MMMKQLLPRWGLALGLLIVTAGCASRLGKSSCTDGACGLGADGACGPNADGACGPNADGACGPNADGACGPGGCSLPVDSSAEETSLNPHITDTPTVIQPPLDEWLNLDGAPSDQGSGSR